jgi:hypothetical protein
MGKIKIKQGALCLCEQIMNFYIFFDLECVLWYTLLWSVMGHFSTPCIIKNLIGNNIEKTSAEDVFAVMR